MKLNVEKAANSKAILEVEIDRERMDKALDNAYHRLVRKVNIPGFRKGKAPRVILERYVGKAAFYRDALDYSIGEWYQEAVAEAKVKPIGEPSVEILKFEPDEANEPVKFKATVDIKPEVKLGDYKNISIHKEKAEVSNEDVDRQIESIRQSQAKLTPVEDGAAEEGMFVVLDVKAAIDGEEFRPMTAENMLVEMKESSIFPGFLEQLKGAKVGEDRRFKSTMPPEHPVEAARGKEIEFSVKVKEIKRLVLPEIDEAFAQSAGFQSLQEMRTAVENNLKTARERAIDRAFDSEVLRNVLGRCELDLPESLVKTYADQARKDIQNRLEAKGTTLEEYLSMINKNSEDLEKEILVKAQGNAKADLVLDAIAEVEKIEPTPEEVEEAVKSVANVYEKPLDEVKKLLNRSAAIEAIKDDIKKGKTMKFLSEIALKNASEEQTGGQEDVRVSSANGG